MVDAPATSSRYFEKAMAIAKEDLEWWHCERVALLDVGSINFDIGDTSVWNEERLTGLHERTMSKGHHIRWARPIARVYSHLAGDEREVARQRWLTFNGDHGFVTSQFTVDGENGCVDPETEILTIRGWQTHHEVQEGDLVATMGLSSEQLEWQPILGKIVAPYKGKMLHVQTSRVDMLLTPNHRVVFQRQLRGRWGPFQVARVDQMPPQNTKIRIPQALPGASLRQFACWYHEKHDGRWPGEWIDYEGLVWCVQTPNSTWVARRNGSIFVTGNSYTGIVLNLPESLAALSEERAKRVPPPRTVMEMLEDWARRSTKRRVEDLRRMAIRSYARTLHAYANTLVTHPDWLREALNLRARRRRNRKDA